MPNLNFHKMNVFFQETKKPQIIINSPARIYAKISQTALNFTKKLLANQGAYLRIEHKTELGFVGCSETSQLGVVGERWKIGNRIWE